MAEGLPQDEIDKLMSSIVDEAVEDALSKDPDQKAEDNIKKYLETLEGILAQPKEEQEDAEDYAGSILDTAIRYYDRHLHFEKVEPYLAQAVKVINQFLQEYKELSPRDLAHLAFIQWKTGHHAEAEANFKKVIDAHAKNGAAEADAASFIYASRTMEQLAEMYEELERIAEAAAYRAKAQELIERLRAFKNPEALAEEEIKELLTFLGVIVDAASIGKMKTEQEKAAPGEMSQEEMIYLLKMNDEEARKYNELGNQMEEEERYENAFKWYTKAAEMGNALGMVNLGTLYFSGKGTAQNYTMALGWFRRAAALDHAGAQYMVAHCFENGLGIEKDQTSAIEWYKKSAKGGDEGAKARLEELGK